MVGKQLLSCQRGKIKVKKPTECVSGVISLQISTDKIMYQNNPLQELKGMQFQEQEESIQITLLQSIAVFGAHCRGANAELLVLLLLLGRIGDQNACMTAVAADLLSGT